MSSYVSLANACPPFPRSLKEIVLGSIQVSQPPISATSPITQNHLSRSYHPAQPSTATQASTSPSTYPPTQVPLHHPHLWTASPFALGTEKEHLMPPTSPVSTASFDRPRKGSGALLPYGLSTCRIPSQSREGSRKTLMGCCASFPQHR